MTALKSVIFDEVMDKNKLGGFLLPHPEDYQVACSWVCPVRVHSHRMWCVALHCVTVWRRAVYFEPLFYVAMILFLQLP